MSAASMMKAASRRRSRTRWPPFKGSAAAPSKRTSANRRVASIVASGTIYVGRQHDEGGVPQAIENEVAAIQGLGGGAIKAHFGEPARGVDRGQRDDLCRPPA